MSHRGVEEVLSRNLAPVKSRMMTINQLSRAEGGLPQVCRKCAVRFDPVCAKSLLFNTELDRFRAGLIVGKLLMFNGARTWKALPGSPTLNQ
jgi:hypothetical protein